jgi:hypothetical protein
VRPSGRGRRREPAGRPGQGSFLSWRTLARHVLEITAPPTRRDHARHFTAYYGPTIAARANAVREGREAEFGEAPDPFCDEWNRGTADRARFEKEFLLAVGTRRAATWPSGG